MSNLNLQRSSHENSGLKLSFVILVVIVLFSGTLFAGELEIKFIYKKAVSLLKDNNYIEAKKLLLKIVKINGNIPEVHNNLGYTFERLLDWDSAELAYKRALKLRKTYFACKNNLANIYLKKGVNIGKALEMLGELVRKYPDNSDILDSYGWATFLFDQQNSDSAVEFLKKAIFFNIGNYWAQYHLGIYYQKKGDFDLSEKFLKKALNSCPDEILDIFFFRYYLCRCYRLWGKVEKASEIMDVLKNDLKRVTEIPHFHDIAGYKKFFELMKKDILCQYRMSLITGFTNIVRKNNDQKVILDSEINLFDIKDYSIFKGLDKEKLLFSDFLSSCKYHVDAKGKVVCADHGYSLKIVDISDIITEYYSKADKYTEVMNAIKSTELGKKPQQTESENENK